MLAKKGSAFLLSCSALLLAASGFAGASGAVASPQMQSGGKVVASGLANPRGLTADDMGNLYVAEAGLGGTDSVKVNRQGEEQTINRGMTGKVTKIAPDGTKSTLLGNLPSIAFGENEVSGPTDIVYANGSLWLATSYVIEGLEQREGEASIYKIDPQSGAAKIVANIGAYEKANDPDGFGVESDPYGLAVAGDGHLYVADAGGNVVYHLDAATGDLEVHAVIPGLPGPQANPGRGGKSELDPVPTSVFSTQDGSVYVGLLTGFPFPTGGAKVMRISPEGEVTEAAGGFSMIVSMEVGPDFQPYVTEFAKFDMNAQGPPFLPGTGRVLRVNSSGGNEVAAEGLNYPNGIAFDNGGNLYVAVNSATPVQAGAQGQILRFDGVAASNVVGMPTTGSGNDLAMYLALLGLVTLAGGTVLAVVARVGVRRAL